MATPTQHFAQNSTEPHTSPDSVAIAAGNAIALPDFDHYAERGLLPAVPAEVTEAAAHHRRVVAGYRQATERRAQAQATIRGKDKAMSAAIVEAIETGADPTAAEEKVRAELAAAQGHLDDTSGVFIGHIKTLHRSTAGVMTAIEDWAPQVGEHLAEPIAKAQKKVADAAAAHRRASEALAELQVVANWINGVRLEGGAQFPNTVNLVTRAPDDDDTRG